MFTRNKYIKTTFDIIEDNINLVEVFSIANENHELIISSFKKYDNKLLSDYFIKTIEDDIISIATKKTFVEDIKIYNLI